MIPRTVWQLAGGPASWSYADVFLKYGVGLIGPGGTGAWEEGRDDEEFEGYYVRHFASEMEVGDIVLLRKGLSTITAIGIVASPYLYLDQFDDLNVWDLSHARRIRWCKLPKEYMFETAVFGANPVRCSRTWNEEARDFAERFVCSPPTEWQEAPLPPLPQSEPELVSVPPQLEAIIAQIQDLSGLFWDREKFGEHPKEDELVAHFIIPFLYAMGWPAEKIAIKWRDIDIAVFSTLPRIPENCRFVIEAKRISEGAEGALEQAKRYVESLAASCDIVLTDGFRYRLYSFEKGFAPVAYANLTRLKQSATELFERMKRP
jgi:hypothetical protein